MQRNRRLLFCSIRCHLADDYFLFLHFAVLLLYLALLLLDFPMFFEELVEEHGVHCFVAHAVDFSITIANDQIRIHLHHLFSDQAKLRCSFAVALVLEAHWLKSEDRFARFVHWPDLLLEPRCGRNRAKLTVAIYHDCVAYYCGPANASDKGGRMDSSRADADRVGLGHLPRITDINIVLAEGERGSGTIAQSDIAAAVLPFAVVKRRRPDGCILVAFSVGAERILPYCCVVATGSYNTAVGKDALSANRKGNQNTAIGSSALDHCKGENSSGNIALGNGAGTTLTLGKDNIYIGNPGQMTEANTIRIGTTGIHAATFIAGISGAAVVGDTVVVDGNGQLGTVASAARFKKEIRPMDKTSEAILALKPVSFQYKSDSKGTAQFGLVAEEVVKVNPDLVVRDRNGEIYSVRYEAVNAMLLNEFLKEHGKVEQQERKIQEQDSKVEEQEVVISQVASNAAKQEATIALQQKEIQALTATLKEQASQIQKVSAKLELNNPAPQTVFNKQR